MQSGRDENQHLQVLSLNKVDCLLLVGEEILARVEEFKYLEVLNGWMDG